MITYEGNDSINQRECQSLIPGPVLVIMMVIAPGPPAGESGPLGVAGSPLLSVGGVFGVAEALWERGVNSMLSLLWNTMAFSQ